MPPENVSERDLSRIFKGISSFLDLVNEFTHLSCNEC